MITVDLHSELDRELLCLPVLSLSTARLFAEALRKQGQIDITIVAPDN
jgi:phosphoribosylpyrophosphate synthetase